MTIAPFGLILPAQIRFGRGEALASVPKILTLGRRVVLVHGRSADRAAPLVEALTLQGAEVLPLTCAGEPDLAMLKNALETARPFGTEVVIALGGGAALDLGKALAALIPAPNPDPMEHLEVVGRGQPLQAAPLPFVALPTTSGTGSEVTRNAVICVPEHRRKVSLRDPRMMAVLAIVDPALTDGAPHRVTLASGLDAVTQVIEPYLSARANPMTDTLCRDAIPRGLKALARLMEAPDDAAARDDLALVAHLSGIALANAGLGAVHGVAGVLGGETGASHGEICGQLLAPVLRGLTRTVKTGSQLEARLKEVDDWCRAALGTGIEGLGAWSREQGLPLPERPLDRATAVAVADASARSSSMKASPVVFSTEDLTAMLDEAGWIAG